MARDYDLVVAGAGPAGATCALYARRHGLRVLLLDKHRFPRDKICGDAVARKSLGYLRDLGLLDAVRARTHEPIGAALLSSPAGSAVRVDLNPHSAPEDPHLVCRREIFDNVLVEAARRDVDVCEGWSVRGVVARGNTVSGVIVRDAEGATHEIAARAVVGADGYNSAIARSLGLYRHDSTRWWVGTRAYYRGLDVPARTVEIHYVDDILPGFLWFFPTGDGVVNVGLGMIHRTLKRSGRSIRDVHRAVVASPRFRERFAGAEELGDISGWHLPTPDAARAVSGPGFLLAGDAAGLVDPFSGEGIGNAMCSGEVAARTVADICSSTQAGTPQEAAAFARYDATLWNALDKRELALHYRLRSLAKRRWIIDLLVGRAAERSDVLDWFVAMTDEHGAVERKRALTSPLTYLKLLFMGK